MSGPVPGAKRRHPDAPALRISLLDLPSGDDGSAARGPGADAGRQGCAGPAAGGQPPSQLLHRGLRLLAGGGLCGRNLRQERFNACAPGTRLFGAVLGQERADLAQMAPGLLPAHGLWVDE